MRRLNHANVLMFSLATALALNSASQAQSLSITQPASRVIALKGETISIAWTANPSDNSDTEYDLSVSYNDKGVFTQLVAFHESSFDWRIPDDAGKVAAFRVDRQVSGVKKETATSGDLVTILDEQDRKALQVGSLIKSNDNSGSYRGFGFNIGANFDLIDGLKNSSLFSELRFTEPVLIGSDKINEEGVFQFIKGIIGGSVALRQSRAFLPKDNPLISVTKHTPINPGVVQTQSAQVRFSRSIDMDITTLEGSLFFPLIHKTIDVDLSRPWSVTERSEVLLAVTYESELFDRSLTASYEPGPSVVNVERSTSQGITTTDTVTYSGVAFKESFNSRFSYRSGVGLSLFFQSPSLFYQLHLLFASTYMLPVHKSAYGFITSNVYMKKLGGLSLGLRYWGHRGAALPDYTTDRPSWIDEPKPIEFKDEFEFFLVKYFSLEKFLDIFKV